MKDCWRTSTTKEEGTIERMHLNDARTWESAPPDLHLKFDRESRKEVKCKRLAI
jgi:hypothetical protein